MKRILKAILFGVAVTVGGVALVGGCFYLGWIRTPPELRPDWIEPTDVLWGLLLAIPIAAVKIGLDEWAEERAQSRETARRLARLREAWPDMPDTLPEDEDEREEFCKRMWEEWKRL